MKKLKQSLLILFAFCMLIFPGIKSEAAAILRQGTVTAGYEYEHIGFSMPNKGIIVISLNIKRTDGKTFKAGEKLDVVLSRKYSQSHYDNEYEEEYDEIELPSGYKESPEELYCARTLDKGAYCYAISTDKRNQGTYKITYKIKRYPFLSSSYQLSKSTIQVEIGKMANFTIKGNPSGSYFGYKDISSTNKSIADVWFVSRGDYIHTYEVEGKKLGTCKIAIEGYGTKGKKTYLTVKVIEPKTPQLKYTSLYLNKGQTYKNELQYAKSQVTWSSSNRSIATVDSNGKVTAKNVGTCKITARTNGKNYVCKVTVQYLNPNFGAVLDSYYSRGKQFTVKFKNNGSKDLTILSSGASALHYYYTSLDCKLKVNKTTIHPGQTKYIKFTAYKQPWYEWYHYNINYYFMYDGKKYNGIVWDDGSSCKYSNGKWYTTYWKTYTDWYNDWKY